MQPLSRRPVPQAVRGDGSSSPAGLENPGLGGDDLADRGCRSGSALGLMATLATLLLVAIPIQIGLENR
ncbi:hypothetical protein ELH92_04655 [Rhizobium ruizarguesonis]|uniref:Uncharacterized protein n=1 Tax=Rhizobium ruizarguesonis TaxID=2081791 RepID=A0AAE8QAB3_9HYPH|nr:hypothetical protein [Rhizobium leguminosarum bv. viciae]TAT98842.1 hypothetical protein ELI53_04605 [Rhizobium ruizarguesonis]NKL44370.1 hypothetical protein [Rhizobium leguminosarum bv. viciae]TAU47369.1 hypothetical protein ELI42_04685 [Rhizobium ruizarguesonis]TAU62440.1 hypothetical protein ELI44_04710 [Rhizobium ruizarguesonis]